MAEVKIGDHWRATERSARPEHPYVRDVTVTAISAEDRPRAQVQRLDDGRKTRVLVESMEAGGIWHLIHRAGQPPLASAPCNCAQEARP